MSTLSYDTDIYIYHLYIYLNDDDRTVPMSLKKLTAIQLPDSRYRPWTCGMADEVFTWVDFGDKFYRFNQKLIQCIIDRLHWLSEPLFTKKQLTGIEIPIINVRPSDDRLRFMMITTKS